MKKRIVTAVGLRVIPPAVATLMRVWFATCRVRVHNEHYFIQPDEKNKVVLASFWHYTVAYVFYFLRKYSATVMVSSSRDGDYVARLAQTLGFMTVRGSKNSRGVQALKGMLRAVKGGQNGAIVADGSQGPPRKAQPGVILVASRTGVPIVPMVWSASNYFCFRSWDRTALPRPFSQIDFFYGEPLLVPSGLDPSQVEEYREILEKRLNDLYREAWKIHGREAH